MLVDRGDDVYDQFKQRTALAYIKHQAGRRADAAENFRAADALRERLDFTSPSGWIVERLAAFHYGDFLLGENRFEEVIRLIEPIVAEGAETERSRLAIALARCVLGRAYLGRWTVSTDEASRAEAAKALQQAVEGIRQADREDCLALALLWRARYHLAVRQLDSAHQDVREMYRVVDRGNMKLYEADAHLLAAQLLLAESAADPTNRNKQQARSSLDQARTLIASTGYYSRNNDVAALSSVL